MFKERSMEELRKIQKVIIYVIIPFLLLAIFAFFATVGVKDFKKQKSVPNHKATAIVVMAIE